MNCKPGDLAIIINAITTPEMIGYIVEVLRPAVDGEPLNDGSDGVVKFRDKNSVVWWCKSKGSLIPVRKMSGHLSMVSERAINDMLLRPIKGLTSENEQDEHASIPSINPQAILG